MASADVNIGGLAVPAPAGGDPLSALSDPLVDGLLDYTAFMINKLSLTWQQTIPRKVSDDPFVAVPDNARFNENPLDPENDRKFMPTPSLWVWWDGISQKSQITTAFWQRARELRLIYVFTALPALNIVQIRKNMWRQLDDILMEGSINQWQPGYQYTPPGASSPLAPAGTSLVASISNHDSIDWDYLGGGGVRRIGTDEPNQEDLGVHNSGRHFPGFVAKFACVEKTDHSGNVYLTGSTLTQKANGVDIMDGHLPPPDGTEGC